MNYKFIDLFAGIGGSELPLKRQVADVSSLLSGMNPLQITYEANFGEKPDGGFEKSSIVKYQTMIF